MELVSDDFSTVINEKFLTRVGNQLKVFEHRIHSMEVRTVLKSIYLDMLILLAGIIKILKNYLYLNTTINLFILYHNFFLVFKLIFCNTL